MFALLVLERRTTEGFDGQEIAQVHHIADIMLPSCRRPCARELPQRSASVFEREQLAREMHNGVARTWPSWGSVWTRWGDTRR